MKVQILEKRMLGEHVFQAVLHAPLIAAKALPGQFVIIRVDENGERIPLTISDYDREKGTITLVVQIVGATTAAFGALEAGDALHDAVGPLGNPSDLEGISSAAVIGGGVGCSRRFPPASGKVLQ